MMIIILRNCWLEDIKVPSRQFSAYTWLAVQSFNGGGKNVSPGFKIRICWFHLSWRFITKIKDQPEGLRGLDKRPYYWLTRWDLPILQFTVSNEWYSGGFTKSGHPLIIVPDNYLFFEVVESDLHLLLKYYISIIPMAKQVLYLLFKARLHQ